MSRASGRVTIRDVAARAGVSIATVSRAINHYPGVDPELVARVEAAAAELGYVPDQIGRALSGTRNDLWNIVVPELNVFYSAVVEAAETVAIENGAALMLSNTHEQLDREAQYLKAANSHRVSGVVITAVDPQRSDLSPLNGIPKVLVNREVEGFDGDVVLSDNAQAGQMVAKHLIERGFTRPAVIVGPEHQSAGQLRLLSFLETMKNAGLAVAQRDIARVEPTAAAARSAAHMLLTRADRPDALFALNARLSVGMFQAVQYLGAPVGMVGTDDDTWAELVHPAMTMIAQPTAKMGDTAARLLASRIDGDKSGAQRVILPPTLVIRGSSQRRA
ncbi:MAG: LacI family transcriptional regulator [Propionibacteriaceae bacterium]|jgi:DNA-binding LacI/PurR family transcriptional regulator|nr:LacI family transcriptional regulator [Propionibacteriaceae bacterium]